MKKKPSTGPYVTLRLLAGADAERHHLVPGDVIGRSPRADLRLNAPEVSELHALVSLRRDGLTCMPLRGRVLADGDEVDGAGVPLRPGQRLRFAQADDREVEDLVLRVEAVEPAPTETWLEGLRAPVRLYPHPDAELWIAAADGRVSDTGASPDVRIWLAGDGWWVDPPSGPLRPDQRRARPLGAGRACRVYLDDGPRDLRTVERPVGAVAPTARRMPLLLLVSDRGIDVRDGEQTTHKLDGLYDQFGRLASLLLRAVHAGAPRVPRRTVSERIWPGERVDLTEVRLNPLLSHFKARLDKLDLGATLEVVHGDAPFVALHLPSTTRIALTSDATPYVPAPPGVPATPPR